MRLLKSLLSIVMLLVVLQVGFGPQPSVLAQTEGTATLTSPLEGAVVSGVVPILGTATHPGLVRYELAFAYLPNPTDTWFSISSAAEPPNTAITDGVLGRWDTSQIADGLYTLRLRVFFAEREFIESTVPAVRVQNANPTPAPTLTLPPASQPADFTAPPPTLAASATAVIALPPTLTPRPSATPRAGVVPTPAALPARLNLTLLQSAFWAGVQLTLISFGVIGMYLLLRLIWRR